MSEEKRMTLKEYYDNADPEFKTHGVTWYRGAMISFRVLSMMFPDMTTDELTHHQEDHERMLEEQRRSNREISKLFNQALNNTRNNHDT